ncbi:lipoprotein [Janthinobacterium lividum]|uniref:Lipoprotein n=1 Tax=Janthinobacterium lividum TaxID=29581 RepID=A0A1S1UFN2_9BURK|nr:CAP domain-containing protein [Janthinobacterium lividum]OHV99177.1 lipoprotein [Janthinobacterium lividum]
MVSSLRWKRWIPALLSAALLSACGGGSSDSSNAAQNTSTPAGQLVQEPGAPALSNNIATDGFNWFNYRRSQIGLSPLARNGLIDSAALGHSSYLNLNNTVAHEQVQGKPGFTGVTLGDRLAKAGYVVTSLQGEVIAGAGNTSGFYLAEELVTAIYHRFVIFEPLFREGGAGAAVSGAGYAYFTTDMASNRNYGPGLAAGQIVTYPSSGQQKVAVSFSSDNEAPDPVPNQDVVGYPISVHANYGTPVSVTAFSVRQRGAGADLTVRLLTSGNDAHTPVSAASIIPLAPLTGNTSYDVSFIGKVNGADITRNWSFTTR